MNVKTRLGWLIAGATLGVLAVVLALHDDMSVSTEVHIDRTPAEVWTVVANGPLYHEWNPFITEVDGAFVAGSKIRIVLGSAPNSMTFNPTVILVRPERDLCWRGSVWIRGIFDGDHCIHIFPERGGSRVEQAEGFSGLLVGRLTRSVVEETRQNMETMNSALKHRVELRSN
jgi:hypothetical protein